MNKSTKKETANDKSENFNKDGQSTGQKDGQGIDEQGSAESGQFAEKTNKKDWK